MAKPKNTLTAHRSRQARARRLARIEVWETMPPSCRAAVDALADLGVATEAMLCEACRHPTLSRASVDVAVRSLRVTLLDLEHAGWVVEAEPGRWVATPAALAKLDADRQRALSWRRPDDGGDARLALVLDRLVGRPWLPASDLYALLTRAGMSRSKIGEALSRWVDAGVLRRPHHGLYALPLATPGEAADEGDDEGDDDEALDELLRCLYDRHEAGEVVDAQVAAAWLRAAGWSMGVDGAAAGLETLVSEGHAEVHRYGADVCYLPVGVT